MQGAVACGHPVTAEAAVEILEDGGNAFDAALAALCAACVAEPVLTSLGGGGFLLAHPAGSEPMVFDFFADTPRSHTTQQDLDFHPIEADFGTTTQEFHIGLGSVATPGVVRGIFAAHRQLGRLPVSRLFAPAIRAAREGVTLNALQASIFRIVGPIYLATAGARDTYATGSAGGLPDAGERLRQPALADTLAALAEEGDALFYEGELARRIVALCAEGGGYLSMDDLAGYAVIRRAPLCLRYRDTELLTNPGPSSGGVLIAFAAALLESCPLGAAGFGAPGHLLALAEAMEATQLARLECLAHPEAHLETQLLHPEYLARYRAEIVGRRRSHRGTTHISVVDADGNAAALTASNGEGCGHVLPGTGIMLNNMLGEEDINPGGFHAWRPGERLTSMMAPTLIEWPDGRRVALGSGGSNRIRTAILQVLVNLVDFALPIDEAVTRPRLHHERGRLDVEPGFPSAGLAALAEAWAEPAVWEAPNLFFGGVHTVEYRGGRFAAAGDPRRGGTGRTARVRQ